MLLFKIFQEFSLPSVLVFVLILSGLILLKSGKKQGEKLLIFGVAFYYFFSIAPASDLILAPLENQYPPIKKEETIKADKIVLLLGGKESDVLRGSEVLRIFNFQAPIFPPEADQPWAGNKFPISKFQIIISGTDPLNPKINEAGEVKEFLAERGISPENIILEDKSRNTFESAKNIREMVGDEPFFLVTSAYHMPRSAEIFKKLRLNPIPAPADFKIKKHYSVLDFFPDAQNLKNSNLAFHEYFGILFYWIKY